MWVFLGIFTVFVIFIIIKINGNKQLQRSFSKSKVMKSAFIKYNRGPKSNNYEDLVSYKEECLRELYNFLLKDEILSPAMKEFTYDEFYNYVFEIEMMGLGYAKDGNYIPISAFCFMMPLGAVLAYREKSIDRDTLREVLSEYFK